MCAGISARPAPRGREDVQLKSISIRAGAGRVRALLAELSENAHSAHGRNCCLLEKKIINNFLLQFTLCSSRAGNKTILGAVKQL